MPVKDDGTDVRGHGFLVVNLTSSTPQTKSSAFVISYHTRPEQVRLTLQSNKLRMTAAFVDTISGSLLFTLIFWVVAMSLSSNDRANTG